MKHTNRKDYNDALRAYLLPIIEEKAEELGETTGGNPFAWLVDVAKSEVPCTVERYGLQDGLEHWLSGLGMGIAFYNDDIIAIAEALHECTLSEKEKDKVCENWFQHIAAKILQYSRR
jgi:hypothetical protein